MSKLTRNALVLSWGMPMVMRYTAKALKGLGFNPLTVFRGPEGGQTWVSTAVEYIDDHRPSYLFSWQRLYGQARPIWRIARAFGVKQVIMDFGLWPHYLTAIYDPQGENYESALVGNFDAVEADPKQRKYIDEMMPTVDQIKQMMEMSASSATGMLSGTPLKRMPTERNFVFLALQRCARGRPDKVLELDAVPSRREPLQIAQDVIAECKKQNRFVIIKQHPQGINLTDKISERGPHHWLMPMVKGRQRNEVLFGWCTYYASHVVTVNSTTWSLGLACGKPVACLGRGWYSHNNVVKECKLVRDAIPTPEPSGERGRRFVALMLSRQLQHAQCEKPNHVRRILNRIYPGGL